MRLRRDFGTEHSLLFPLLVVLIVAGVAGAFAQGLQSRRDVAFAASTEIDAAIARAAASTTAVARFLPDDVYQYFAAMRKQPGLAEIHRQWNDVTIIRSGKGVLRTGHIVNGQREVSPGEWRGETIQDSINRRLSAGDLVVIPAGMAHQLTPIGSDPLTHVTVKVPVDAERVNQ
jgi:mannose-6-phosphate isomerase-like protein (cupin superfamily)